MAKEHLYMFTLIKNNRINMYDLQIENTASQLVTS